jgi:ABC-type glycerol-3-phosphate transport system permease component
MATISRFLPAALILVGVIVVWEVLVKASGVQVFTLPAPSAIWAALVENWTVGHAILPAAQVTFFEAIGGLVIGTVLGVLTAFVVSRFPAPRTRSCRSRSRSTRSRSSRSPPSPTTGSASSARCRRWRSRPPSSISRS